MSTAIAPPGPPPAGHPNAQWNGEKWFDLAADGQSWIPLNITPALPPPGAGNVAAAGQPPAVNTGDDAEEVVIIEGTYGDYFDQPVSAGGGGPTWKFHEKDVMTSYRGFVAEDLPIRITSQKRGQNGQSAWQMWVPMIMMPEEGYPEGRAQAVFKGDSRDKLNAAMASVGAPLTHDPKSGKDGYVPKPGAFIQMTRIGEQKGTNRAGDKFTKYIYEVHYRNADDPNIIELRQQVMDAVASIEEAPPPPKMRYDPASKQWVVDTTASAPAPATPAVHAPPPPPAATAPATPAPPTVPPAATAPPVPPAPPVATVSPAATTTPQAPPLPPAATPAAVDPSQTAEAVQAAAAHVATADQAATPATNGATAPNITDEQWINIPAAARALIAERAGVKLPGRYDPASPDYMNI
jgi:hypothetical protein